MQKSLALLALACGGLACGGRSTLGVNVEVTPCPDMRPSCVAVGDDPCGAPVAVDALCDASSRSWSCPVSSVVRAPLPTGVCLPFHDGTFRTFEGPLVRIPTDDGRCLWIAEDVTMADGTHAHNWAIDATPASVSGGCPAHASSVGDIVVLEKPDASLVVQIDGGYRFGGASHILYRLFRLDPNAGFGLAELGGGFAHWDSGKKKIVVPAQLNWGPDLSLGDAVLARPDHLYVWGCPSPPHFLTDKCLLTRFDGAESMELFGQDNQWTKSTDASHAATLFDSGPWISSVIPSATGLVHVYAVGFGTNLQTHTSATPTSPWSTGATIAKCAVPATDQHSYCAGPVVHAELADPRRAKTIAVSYGVGTTSPDGLALRVNHPDDYWTKLVWVDVP